MSAVPRYGPYTPPAPPAPAAEQAPVTRVPADRVDVAPRRALPRRPLNVPDRDNPYRPAIDPQMAEEALTLELERIGPGQYAVWGGREPHFVELDPYFECDCGAFLWVEEQQPVICKHLIRALADTGDGAAVAALREAAGKRADAAMIASAEPAPRPRRQARRSSLSVESSL